jgi:hypothetical protein
MVNHNRILLAGPNPPDNVTAEAEVLSYTYTEITDPLFQMLFHRPDQTPAKHEKLSFIEP